MTFFWNIKYEDFFLRRILQKNKLWGKVIADKA